MSLPYAHNIYKNISSAKITAARFIGKSERGLAVEFDSVSPVIDGTVVYLYDGKRRVCEGRAVRHRSSLASGTVDFAGESEFDIAADYRIGTNASETVAVSKTRFIDTEEFISRFENEETKALEYGALYGKTKTLFRVWAPFATSVKLVIFADNRSRERLFEMEMEKRFCSDGTWGGVWEEEILGDLDGWYYNYIIDNYGSVSETVDPYAKACNANGNRGMVVDLARTSPEGWAQDKHIYKSCPKAADDPIVWEVHVGDFSASPDSGMKYKGKYLAFTETGTTVPGDPTLKTGVDYLKELGVTYVQLNPVFDFATIDESELTIADDCKDEYNWGYDPQNYNIPEGSYSTDPTHGEVRINEFKQMVMALHKAGIGVVMDVVYNHTYSTNTQALHDTVPFYYHRTNAEGVLTNGSGCGNETASERAMFRKYIIDSVLYWAEEYHIDGFRFDLMGLHDMKTVAEIRSALDRSDNGNGVKLLMYGEPWSADGDYIPASFERRIKAAGETGNTLVKCNFMHGTLSALPARVAIFNDTGRDGLRGNNDPGIGWVQGNADGAPAVSALLSGTCRDLKLLSRNVAYASAHDNYTLWDQLIGKRAGMETPLFYENAIEYNIELCKLVSAAYLMSPGIAFMLAGEEMGRTKYGNHNSYNSSIKLNRIVWSRQTAFAELVEHYKTVIQLRKFVSRTLFSYGECAKSDMPTGEFGCDGLKISGVRRGKNGETLRVSLDATPGAQCGVIEIGERSYKF